VASDLSLDVRIAPEGAAARMSSAINRPKRRAFGVFKMESEFVGVCADHGFEVWERQRRAVRAVGAFRSRKGGTRIEVRFVVPPRTRVLIALFFALYAVASLAMLLRPDPPADVARVSAAVLGGLVVAIFFFAAARSQREDLRRFVERVYGADAT
jgi:hypothetical protein